MDTVLSAVYKNENKKGSPSERTSDPKFFQRFFGKTVRFFPVLTGGLEPHPSRGKNELMPLRS